jgi:hypothetical protein
MSSARPELLEALAALSWEEADARLAEAWAECARMQSALAALRRSGGPAADSAADAAALLRQALEGALRARGLASISRAGAVQKFDPTLHEVQGGQAAPAAEVRVIAPGVARGGDATRPVRRALVRPLRRRGTQLGSAAP